MRPLLGLSHQAPRLAFGERGAGSDHLRLRVRVQDSSRKHLHESPRCNYVAVQETCFVLTERSARSPELFNVWRTGYVLKRTAPQESAYILDPQGGNAST